GPRRVRHQEACDVCGDQGRGEAAEGQGRRRHPGRADEERGTDRVGDVHAVAGRGRRREHARREGPGQGDREGEARRGAEGREGPHLQVPAQDRVREAPGPPPALHAGGDRGHLGRRVGGEAPRPQGGDAGSPGAGRGDRGGGRRRVRHRGRGTGRGDRAGGAVREGDQG